MATVTAATLHSLLPTCQLSSQACQSCQSFQSVSQIGSILVCPLYGPPAQSIQSVKSFPSRRNLTQVLSWGYTNPRAPQFQCCHVQTRGYGVQYFFWFWRSRDATTLKLGGRGGGLDSIQKLGLSFAGEWPTGHPEAELRCGIYYADADA